MRGPQRRRRRRSRVLGEIHLFGPDFVLSVWHGNAPALRPVRKRLETGPDLLGQRLATLFTSPISAVTDPFAALRLSADERWGQRPVEDLALRHHVAGLESAARRRHQGEDSVPEDRALPLSWHRCHTKVDTLTTVASHPPRYRLLCPDSRI